MRMLAAIAGGAALLAACASRPALEPVVRTIEVQVPVPTPCRPAIGPAPAYADSPDALAAAADVFEAMRLRIVGREQRRAREAVLDAALAGCAGVELSETDRQ